MGGLLSLSTLGRRMLEQDREPLLREAAVWGLCGPARKQFSIRLGGVGEPSRGTSSLLSLTYNLPFDADSLFVWEDGV